MHCEYQSSSRTEVAEKTRKSSENLGSIEKKEDD